MSRNFIRVLHYHRRGCLPNLGHGVVGGQVELFYFPAPPEQKWVRSTRAFHNRERVHRKQLYAPLQYHVLP